jgi:hypothetical protein
LFSDIVNRLRAAIDNVMFHVVEALRGSPLPDDAAVKVACRSTTRRRSCLTGRIEMRARFPNSITAQTFTAVSRTSAIREPCGRHGDLSRHRAVRRQGRSPPCPSADPVAGAAGQGLRAYTLCRSPASSPATPPHSGSAIRLSGDELQENRLGSQRYGDVVSVRLALRPKPWRSGRE